VQVSLKNADGSQIKVGDRNTMKTISVSSTDTIPINFIASYRASGATTPGVVQTFVTYVIEMP
jgi:major type 1 subunit fimbrin (pilin)